MKIAIASGKGGTGKTFVSTNLFVYLKKLGKKVVLTDCDAEEPNSFLFFPGKKKIKSFDVDEYRPKIDESKCTFCGKCVDFCSYNAMLCIPEMNVIKVVESICHGCTACEVACQDGAITASSMTIGDVTEYEYDNEKCLFESRLRVNNMEAVPAIKEAIKKSLNIPADYYIFDSPPGSSCPFIQTANRADFVLLVSEPTPFGLSDLIQTMDVLEELNKPYAVVINRSDVGNGEMIDVLNKRNVTIVDQIPFMREVADCYAKGGLVVEDLREMEEHFEKISLFLFNKKAELNL